MSLAADDSRSLIADRIAKKTMANYVGGTGILYFDKIFLGTCKEIL